MKHYYKEVEESELQKCVALSQPLISHLVVAFMLLTLNM